MAARTTPRGRRASQPHTPWVCWQRRSPTTRQPRWQRRQQQQAAVPWRRMPRPRRRPPLRPSISSTCCEQAARCSPRVARSVTAYAVLWVVPSPPPLHTPQHQPYQYCWYAPRTQPTRPAPTPPLPPAPQQDWESAPGEAAQAPSDQLSKHLAQLKQHMGEPTADPAAPCQQAMRAARASPSHAATAATAPRCRCCRHLPCHAPAAAQA
jgi:hypothetical protein